MKRPHIIILTAIFFCLAMCVAIPCMAESIPDAAITSANDTDSIGEIITFGHYEQDGNTKNGKEPITWIVLDKNDKGQYLIISEKVLDAKPYDTANFPAEAVWEESTIRSWLNGYGASSNKAGKNYKSKNFIDTAFSSSEKAKIIKTNRYDLLIIIPSGKEGDKLFLLSDTEFKKYFTSNEYGRADATHYAVKQDSPVYGSESGVLTQNGSCTDEHCYAKWWLSTAYYPTCTNCKPNTKASPIHASHRYIDVRDGQAYIYPHSVNNTSLGVRPAMWLQYK